MAHAAHQFTQAGTGRGGDVIAGVPEIAKVDAGQSRCFGGTLPRTGE